MAGKIEKGSNRIKVIVPYRHHQFDDDYLRVRSYDSDTGSI